MNNSGHNCIASQVLILPRDWPGTPRLLDEIRAILRQLPPRPDYYPGAGERLAAVRAAHPRAETYGDPGRILVPDITDHDDIMITTEAFASALGVVRLPGATTAEFLRHATDFANCTLPGTLGATLIVRPRTEKSDRAAVAAAIAGLRYGTLGSTAGPPSASCSDTPRGAPTPSTPGRTSAAVPGSSTTPSCSKTCRRPSCGPLSPLPRGAC